MADNNEIQTSRIIVGGQGSQVDDDFRDFEAAFRNVFGITADTDYSESMQIGGRGRDAEMTGTLTLAGDPTEDNHVATKQYTDNNASTAATVRCTVVLSSTQAITDGNNDALAWDAAHIEAGGECWAIGDPTKIIFPIDGDYLIGGVITGRGTNPTPPYFTVAIRKNGSTWEYTTLGLGKLVTPLVDASVPFAVMDPMVADDYIEIFVSVSNSNHTIAADTYAWIMKVG